MPPAVDEYCHALIILGMPVDDIFLAFDADWTLNFSTVLFNLF